MSSNLAARRVPVRTRSTTVKSNENGVAAPISRSSRMATYKDPSLDPAPDAGPSKPLAAPMVKSSQGNGTLTGVLGTRKRAALGDLTNANRTRNAAAGIDQGKGKAVLKEPLKSRTATSSAAAAANPSRSTTATTGGARRVLRSRQDDAIPLDADPKRPVRQTKRIGATATTTSTNPSTTVRASAPIRRTESIRSTKQTTNHNEVGSEETVTVREPKRIKTDKAPVTHPAKDEGWEDLDAEDMEDPLMVAEYVHDIFDYMKELEIINMPNPDYMNNQTDINWHVRGVLVDWLVDVHAKFRLLPETLFLTLNVIDRFLSLRTITLSKLQLVGVTAMFIAAKYEEVLCPSIDNFVYLSDGGYTDSEVLSAERYMLKVLGFNLSYANPMNFLRRISKADNYDIQTRTVAKYFMEISLVDYRLMEHPPSLIAAAAVWLAREVLERGEWTPTLVHYSTYSEQELLGTAGIMLDYCLRPTAHPFFHKKYAGKKFMRASTYVIDWARNTFPEAVATEEDIEKQDLGSLRVDLFERRGLERPDYSPVASSRGVTPLPDCQNESGFGEHEPTQERKLAHNNHPDDHSFDDHREALRDVTNEYDSIY